MTSTVKRKSMALVMALLLCFSMFVSFGTTALAAGERSEIYMVSFPRDAEANKNSWDRDNLQFMNGWYMEAYDMFATFAVGSYEGKVAYCIEPGTPIDNGHTFTAKDETFWDNYPSSLNKTIDADTIKSLIGRILQYGYEQVKLMGNNVQLESGIMLDLGAVGKGYAGDIAAQVLQENGITSALLDFGGNIQTIGTKPDGSLWRIGLRDPFSGGTLGVLEISNMAAVTSGNYERYFIGENGKRYGHIIDPATGYPAESGLESVTVIAGEGRLCDALSTSLFVMGLDKAIEYWQQRRNFDMLLITEGGEIYLTEGVADSFILNRDRNNVKVNVIKNE